MLFSYEATYCVSSMVGTNYEAIKVLCLVFNYSFNKNFNWILYLDVDFDPESA